MWIAAMIMGLIGGILGLVYGLWLVVFGGVAGAVEGQSYVVYQLVSVLVPVAGIVGAGLVRPMPLIGAILMAGSAAGIFVHFGFGSWTMILMALLGIGAVLALVSMAQPRTAA